VSFAYSLIDKLMFLIYCDEYNICILCKSNAVLRRALQLERQVGTGRELKQVSVEWISTEVAGHGWQI
jgi:hypothetical protein